MKFFSKIKISRKFTVFYCIFLLIGFFIGMLTVNIRCYNSMNIEPMVVFELTDDSVIIMDRSFPRLL